jgi:hypothetical protein
MNSSTPLASSTAKLLTKCWKMNLRPDQYSWWAPTAWRVGAIGLWLWKLRKLNGPNFTWPLLMFANALPEKLMAKMGKIYRGKPLQIKSRKELLAAIRPNYWQHLRRPARRLQAARYACVEVAAGAVIERMIHEGHEEHENYLLYFFVFLRALRGSQRQ